MGDARSPATSRILEQDPDPGPAKTPAFIVRIDNTAPPVATGGSDRIVVHAHREGLPKQFNLPTGCLFARPQQSESRIHLEGFPGRRFPNNPDHFAASNLDRHPPTP